LCKIEGKFAPTDVDALRGINLAYVYSLWSKLANIKVQGVFWPVVESSGCV